MSDIQSEKREPKEQIVIEVDEDGKVHQPFTEPNPLHRIQSEKWEVVEKVDDQHYAELRSALGVIATLPRWQAVALNEMHNASLDRAVAAAREKAYEEWRRLVTGLRDELAAARRDTNRMVWLEEHFRASFGQILPINEKLDAHSPFGKKTKLIRNAIDAAMSKGAESENDKQK